ncbi:hypothetical protein L1049_024803 [Liquidambar formosana]|uniref:Protein kinase domain-containing protein n=1 Tax=Liquidambar formosana TaxID=63359 RepID=A0AAP0X553_LIQFO
MNDLLIYNPQIPNADTVTNDTRINIPFSCDCINGDFLGHVFAYARLAGGVIAGISAAGVSCVLLLAVCIYIGFFRKKVMATSEDRFGQAGQGSTLGKPAEPTGLAGGASWGLTCIAVDKYVQCGDVSPKMDVYAVGVILYELISGKEAIVEPDDSTDEARGLVALFEDVPDCREDLCKLVDPRLGDDYPFDSVRQMTQLARACTRQNPQLRPTMKSVVVALMNLTSSTEDWDVALSTEIKLFPI